MACINNGPVRGLRGGEDGTITKYFVQEYLTEPSLLRTTLLFTCFILEVWTHLCVLRR